MSTSTATIPAQQDLQPQGTSTDHGRGLRIAAGLALAAGPVLWAAGMATSPSAASTADIDYVTSLGRDGTMTQVSALFLHYGNLLIGLGVLASVSLLRGRRGARLTAVGAVLTSLGFTSVAGMLLSDWWNLAVVETVGAQTGAEIFGAFKSTSLLFLWNGMESFGLLGAVALIVGLARAGVLSWWNLGVFAAGFVAMMTIPWDMPALAGGAILVAFSPFAVIGVRLLQRARLTRA